MRHERACKHTFRTPIAKWGGVSFGKEAERERERARAKGATSWGQPASRWALISGVRAALGAVRWEMPPRILVFLVVVFDDVM